MDSKPKAVFFFECSDCRLNEYATVITPEHLDFARKITGEEGELVLLRMRNAGSNLFGLTRSMDKLSKDYEIVGGIIETHTECALVGYVYDIKTGRVKAADYIKATHIDPFDNVSIDTALNPNVQLRRLEIANRFIQERFLYEQLNIPVLLARIVPTKAVGTTHYDHSKDVVAITNTPLVPPVPLLRGAHLNPRITYTLRAPVLEDIKPDLEFFVRHAQKKHVKVIAVGNADLKRARRDAETVNSWIKDTGVIAEPVVSRQTMQVKIRA